MKTYDFDMATPCLLFDITLPNGTEYHVTNAHVSVTPPGGETYTPHPGLRGGVKTARHDGTPSSFGFQTQLLSDDGPFRFRDVERGKYERCRIYITSTSFVTPTASPIFEFDGEVRGGIEVNPEGIATFDVTARLAITRDIMVGTFTLPCSWEIGDPLTCRLPIFPYIFGDDLADVTRNQAVALGERRRFRFGSDGTPEDYLNVYLEATTAGTTAGSAPAFSSTVDATTADGTAVWTTRNALARYAQVTAVDRQVLTLDALPDPRASDANWYSPAKIIFRTGEYKDLHVFKAAGWDPVNFKIECWRPCPFAGVGDWIEIAPGCDQTYARCVYLDNVVNHGGFPFHEGGKLQAQQVGYD